jgi:putative ABC transport system substrate-binding protein
MIGLRIAFSITLLLGGLFSPVAAEAQQAAVTVPRIGSLGNSRSATPHLREAFLQGLRDLGYVEGRNVVIEYRDAEGKSERFPALAAELVALKVDVILAGSTPAALAAKQATRTLPIVFAATPDPVGSGLVTSLARPGGNVTGLSLFAPELVGKRLELLKQAVPGVTRVAVLWQPGGQVERTEKDMLKGAEVAARALGVPNGLMYAAGSLDGIGAVRGARVRCKTAEAQATDRVGYEWRARDFHDVRRLHERLQIPLTACATRGCGPSAPPGP